MKQPNVAVYGSRTSSDTTRALQWLDSHQVQYEFKDLDEPLGDFIKRKGGINACAARFARRLGRGQHRGATCTLP